MAFKAPIGGLFGQSLGIFTGPNPGADTVITIGDDLFGATMENLDFGRGGLNENGNIAFRADLSDGMQIIARANPVSKAILALTAGNIFIIKAYVPRHAHLIGERILLGSTHAPGLEYQAASGTPQFASVLLPEFGDDSFMLHLFDGSADQVLLAEVPHFFGPDGVDRFQILGIGPGTRLDPDVFTTGVTFVRGDEGFTMDLTISPLGVPEPASLVLLLAGLVGLAAARRWYWRG